MDIYMRRIRIRGRSLIRRRRLSSRDTLRRRHWTIRRRWVFIIIKVMVIMVYIGRTTRRRLLVRMVICPHHIIRCIPRPSATRIRRIIRPIFQVIPPLERMAVVVGQDRRTGRRVRVRSLDRWER